MAPTKFQIYVDQSVRQDRQPERQLEIQPERPIERPPRFVLGALGPQQRFAFDERKLYPIDGGEFSFEELNLLHWMKCQQELVVKRRLEELQREVEELRVRNEALVQQLQSQQQRGAGRQSIVPQSLLPEPTQEIDANVEYADMSRYGAMIDAPSVVHDFWRNTFANDKLTVPIDQSQYIRENVPTSTPTSKRDENKRPTGNGNGNGRRYSRPSMGGSPTLKLSPITETSRDCNSKSSSSSSAMSATPGTVKKPLAEPIVFDEPDRPIDPNDPSTYRSLLRGLVEPLERRSGFFRANRSMPKIRNGACFQAGQDSYLVDRELAPNSKMFTAQLLIDDGSSADALTKTICFRTDQPANEWVFYICSELHRRLVKQKTNPDIELSVAMTNPAIIYNDGSILVDEYSRYVTLEHYINACIALNKPFPKSVAAYITLELIQIVRKIHTCEIVHMNLNLQNILITGCPTREDIACVDETTSIVKLIGFDRSIDLHLLPSGFKFDLELGDLLTCEMRDARPWSFEVDWYGTLNCIHKMFFLDDMEPVKENGRWNVLKQFKGFPTDVWPWLFEELLNISDISAATSVIDRAIDDLNTWIKANRSFVLKEACTLDSII